jgi:hypothetical protein
MSRRPRAVYRHMCWVSEPDLEPDAAPLTHRMACDVCGAKSSVSVEFGTVQTGSSRTRRVTPRTTATPRH